MQYCQMELRGGPIHGVQVTQRPTFVISRSRGSASESPMTVPSLSEAS
jgi:hypothetical protein